jgi:hypothetical protein
MNDLQIDYHEDATSVALIVARNLYWLWFTTGPEGTMRPQLVRRDQIGYARDDFTDAEAKGYLEVRMQAAGYELQRSAIQSRDVSVWDIASV